MKHGSHRYKKLYDKIGTQKLWMWLKRLLPWLIVMAMIVPILIFMLLIEKSPKDWVSETITYAHTETVELYLNRYGSRNQALATPDGRLFALFDNQAETVLSRLRPGEKCEIVYEPNFVSHQWIRALRTEEDGVLISLEDSIARYKDDQQELWELMGKLLLIALAAEIPIELLWLKKERARISAVKAQLAKLEAREERQRVYKESKRAGD